MLCYDVWLHDIHLPYSVDIALTNASFLSLSVTIVEVFSHCALFVDPSCVIDSITIALTTPIVTDHVDGFQVVKSCTPILVWLSNLVRGKEEFTFSMLLVVVLLCAGSALASLGGHVTLHVIGFLCAITAACAGALKLVLMETALSRHRQELHTHPLLLWMYIAPVMVACLFFPWLLLEARSLFASPLIQPVALPFTIGYLLIAGVLAFSLVSSELWTIQVTSALSLCVIGILRVVVIIAVTMTLFNDYQASRTNVIGLLLCFIGAAGYNWLRLQKLHSTDAVDGEVEGDESNTASAEEVQALQSTVIDTDGSGSSMAAAGSSAAAGRNAEGDSLLRDTGSASQTGGGRYSSSASSSGATGAGLKPASRDATSARTWPSEPDSGDSADSTQRRLEEQTAKIDRALQEG